MLLPRAPLFRLYHKPKGIKKDLPGCSTRGVFLCHAQGLCLELSRYLTAEEVKTLASLPSKHDLYAMLACVLQAPIRNLACFGNVLLGNTVRALDQIAKKKGEGAPAPAAE